MPQMLWQAGRADVKRVTPKYLVGAVAECVLESVGIPTDFGRGKMYR